MDSTVNLLDIHHKVIPSGKYNFEGCRVPVNGKLNIEYIKSLLHDYDDPLLCDFLEFGFPIGYHSNNEILQQIKKMFGNSKIIKVQKSIKRTCYLIWLKRV